MSENDSAIRTWGFTEFVRNGVASGNVYQDIPRLDGASDAVVSIEGRRLVNFASINFLGLQHDPTVLRRFKDAADVYGIATGGSRATQGVCRPHQEVERLLCEATGKERAISFASGLLANLGFVTAMGARLSMGRGTSVDNSDTVFVLDRYSHWSLFKATEHLEFGKTLVTFRHNDPKDLERHLERLAGRKVVVIFESVYSADGTVAPIGDLVDVCARHGAVSFVDDANGFLVYGPEHRPFAEEYRAMRRADFVMVSFSKSVGLEGGAVAGPADAIHAFDVLSGTSMFTAAMQPPTADAAAYIMRRLMDDHSVVDGYLARVADFRRRLEQTGCTVSPTRTYVISVFIGKGETAEQVRQEFIERGYLVPVFRYPAVKKGESVMRLMLNARHTEEQVDGFVQTLAEVRREYGF
ncbi:aminotransferase class I/II-fold pyridoxal phosphate-dependent enzyme [Streptacidiphilus sp. EB129]|uniref:aminotransferase class I/II-fold pyridoxal phosphate-dependent enzyme n=1 Tax=Streptacidiphilus sp. EB129 TaxID=3156262 RepID=UPI0035118429